MIGVRYGNVVVQMLSGTDGAGGGCADSVHREAGLRGGRGSRSIGADRRAIASAEARTAFHAPIDGGTVVVIKALFKPYRNDAEIGGRRWQCCYCFGGGQGKGEHGHQNREEYP